MNKLLRVAILGAGIFAKRAHIPAMLEYSDKYEIVAIYSRTQESAQARANEIPYPVEVTTEIETISIQGDQVQGT